MSFGENHRLLSRPVRVYWAGWETDTWAMQKNGWELSVDQDHARMRMRMVFRHKEFRFVGQTNDIDFEFLRDEDISMRPLYVWQVQYAAPEVRVHGVNLPLQYANFRPIDAKPRLEVSEVKSLEDLVPFATQPIVTSQSLILPEATVDDLLAGILDRQQEAKSAHFRDLLRRGGGNVPEHRVHAQIISLAA